MPVDFSGPVGDDLPEEIREQLEAELELVMKKLNPVDPGRDSSGSDNGSRDNGGHGDLGTSLESGYPKIYVLRVFAGHTPEFDVKVVLGIEVTYRDRYERHIVKIGTRKKVAPDFEGWQACTRNKNVASRIFAPVRMFELEKDDRVAVLYRDAFTLFGPETPENTQSQPNLLEAAVEWATRDDKPEPISVERALAHIYTDLGLWFYRGAKVHRKLAHGFYAKHLRAAKAGDVLSKWRDDPDRRTLRRQAVWVLAGRDAPDADPITKSAHYLDPIDYVGWAMSKLDGSRLPSTLVGRSHGDMHARNVLVGVRRGEVQYPAVFDYGDMAEKNVLAWDFAKLEAELKVRLLPAILRDEAVMAFLVDRSELRKMTSNGSTIGVRSEASARADRLAAYLAFEELLDHLSRMILDSPDAEQIVPFRNPPTGVPKLDRLASMIMRVRKEAAIWLGFKSARDSTDWMDDHYFALGVYGLINVRWRYSRPEQEAALVSSGVALARMNSTPGLIKTSIQEGRKSPSDYPSYRVPLAIMAGYWKGNRYQDGCELGREVALSLSPKTEIRPEAAHAVPLLGQALLLETEMKTIQGLEEILEDFRHQAREFGDYETLARIGRFFKDSGDLKWEAEELSTESANTRKTWLQMYDRAFAVYAEAFEATGDWYVGINAATLALLTSKKKEAKEYARKVAKICAEHLEHKKGERYWLFATEGEAALILNEPAEDFYRDALDELAPGHWGMADSSYKQACRLWTLLGDSVVPILKLFEDSKARAYLTPNFLGRKFPKPGP